jgi:hypothetical protein
MELANTTKNDLQLASLHVIKAGGSIAATPDVMQYPDNRVAIAMGLNNGTLKLQEPASKLEPEPAKKFAKVKDAD